MEHDITDTNVQHFSLGESHGSFLLRLPPMMAAVADVLRMSFPT